jgi:hypothetical protein
MAMLVSAQLWGQLFTLAPEISRAKNAIARIVGLLELKDNSSKAASGRSTPDTEPPSPLRAGRQWSSVKSPFHILRVETHKF